MVETGFAPDPARLPEPADPQRAGNGLDRWRDAALRSDAPDVRATIDRLLAEPGCRRLLMALFGYSPFLAAVAEREPLFVMDLLEAGPETAQRRVMEDVETARIAALEGNDPASALRIGKRRLAFAAAAADVAGVWPLEAVTGALSDFADAALRCACAYLLRDAARRGALILADPGDPERESGLIVLGMGKLGAGELNYSSDIDLVVFYDPERIRGADPDSLQHTFVRLTRGLVRILDHRTSEGYVFRTDLRLRPDPGATPLAISVFAAEAYYETLGQNWERAALIKARPVAGDRVAGAEFLARLTPFIWRKNLDFAAIQDIHSIKRQIISHRGGAKIATANHNVKLGRGGIREIEFFVQTQQLVWGGRLPEVRSSGTVAALERLAAAGKIAPETAIELSQAYRFLRRLEHRLQMANDEQTHTVPDRPQALADLATFFGYPDRGAFEQALLSTLRTVENHYAHLFENAPALSVETEFGGNLVFTGGDSDPDTLRTLAGLGFRQPRTVDAAVRGWHHGRCRAMRSTRARELLTELMPILLQALANTPDPDATLLAFDRFLTGLPAGIQLFSMFHSFPQLLQLVAEIMGRAPRLAEHLARRPATLESVLTEDFFETPPSPDRLEQELGELLSRCRDLEDVLDTSRRWAADRRFQVGVQSLRGMLDCSATARLFSDIAEVAVRGLYARVKAAFIEHHGRIAGCDMAIIAMGKLGGREMTATSDLDLIFVYTSPSEIAVSEGPRPLPASQYFARLSQRLINALTAPTAEGVLNEVDMRLRPSGKAGPIAVSFESFRRYQSTQAWTWERMALTRARVIAGPPALMRDIEAVIREVLTRKPDPETLLADVADMRRRMEAEHPAQSIWEVKHLRGGIVDIEFIVQYLQLRHAWSHPQVLSPGTRTALQAIRDAGLLVNGQADALLDALALWDQVQGRLRLTWQGPLNGLAEEGASGALRDALQGLTGEDFDRLAVRMRETAANVRQIFEALIGAPAAAAVQPSPPAGDDL